jgi:hypothetical protein
VSASSGLSWFAPAPALRLATLRFLIGGYAFFYLLGRIPALTGVVRYGPAQFHPVGPVHLLEHPLPGALAIGLVVLSIALGAAFFVGWRFKITGPAFAVVFLWVLSYRNSWGMVFHTENLMVLHVWVLGFSRAADALSVDARGRARPDDSPRYGWPIRTMCAATAIAYFIAGYAKVHAAGFDWAFDDTLRSLVAYDNVRKIELGDMHSVLGGFLVGYDWLFPPLALVSLLLELGAPAALLGRRVGVVWSALAWSFHLGVLLMMFILFHYQLFGFAYAPFFRVEKLSEYAMRRIAKRNGSS